jgi:dipeptidyl aminopeptidase/acylaminoacyl peptidase
MMRNSAWLLACLSLSLLAQTAPNQRALTIEESLAMPWLSSPQISPNGERVLYQANKVHWESNEWVAQWWVMHADGSQPRQLTFDAKGVDSAMAWAPDSQRFAFVSSRSGKPRLYLMSVEGGEARLLGNLERAISGLAWSPDGKSLAFLAALEEAKEDKERKEKYGEFTIDDEDYTFQHVWLMDVASGKAEALTTNVKRHFSDLAWSPDGKSLALVHLQDPDLDRSATADISLLSVATKELRLLAGSAAPERSPVWSPDGRQLAFESGHENGAFYRDTRIMLQSIEGGGARELKVKVPDSPSLLGWAGNKLGIYSLDGVHSQMIWHDVNTGESSVVAMNGWNPTSPSLSRDATRAAFMAWQDNGVMEIGTWSAEGGTKKLTNMVSQYAAHKLAKREAVRWKTSDGVAVEGILIGPAEREAGKRYPLLVVIHGGPRGVDQTSVRPDRYYPLEQFVEKGYLVLRPNYRGSAGYGEKFRSLNVRNLGVGDALDVIGGVDELVKQGIVDPQRVGAMGWSQGGYISAFLTTSSTRFRAISVGAGISNWMTYYVNTDIHPFTKQYLQATPWEDPEIYRRTSPMTYIRQAKTPTLIQHGENDRRVPLPNAFELKQGLIDNKVPVRLVVYKGFGHGITKPKQMRHVMEENLQWFTKYVPVN